MRIHSDVLTEQDFRDAAKIAGVGVYRLAPHGSRSRARAFDVIFEGTGRHGGQFGGDYRSASWDEWGMALAVLFERDPNATAPRVYESRDHFHWVTGDRFRSLAPEKQHRRHRWQYAGTAAGTYSVQECKGCPAVQRWLLGGRTFEALALV